MKNLSLYIAVLTLIASGQTTASQLSSENCEPEESYLAFLGGKYQVCFPEEYEGSIATTCPTWSWRNFNLSGDTEIRNKVRTIIPEPNKNLFRIYSEVLVGKGCELFLAESGFDKSQAKALGKVCKYIQAKKPIWDVITIGLTTFGASKIADRIVASRMSLPWAVAIFAGVKSAEYFSHPRVLETLKPEKTSELQQAADYWAIRPAFKTVVTGFRYAEEKIIQLCYTDAFIPLVANALTNFLPIADATAKILAKGGSIGSSKVVTGIIAETILSTARMHVDGDFSFAQLIRDVATGAVLSIVIGVLIPPSLVIITPKVIVVGFFIYTASRVGVAILS